MKTIKFAKVKENAIIPTKEKENAGYDRGENSFVFSR